MKILVENFQSIRRADLEARGLTVIVGPSNRGKSALLRAIEAALFNRTGDQFVRVGASAATVSLEFPDGDRAHTVHWAKGPSVNKFTVDGVDYMKVGTKAPKVLQDLGFRDVLIGARVTDDGRVEGGEVMRPQVARQLKRIFLLEESGPFLNETLVQVSRLGVLQRANRLCSADLRAEKALLKTRQADLTQAEAETQKLAPVVALRDRVHALQAQGQTLQEARARVARLRALLTERATLRACQRPLPVQAPRVAPRGVELLDALAPLVTARRVIVPLAARALPKRVEVKKTAARALEKWKALRPLMIEQRQHRNWVDQYTAATQRKETEAADLQALLDGLRAELKVCPTCDRPF